MSFATVFVATVGLVLCFVLGYHTGRSDERKRRGGS